VPHHDLLLVHRDYRHRGGEEVFLEDHLIPGLNAIGVSYRLVRLPALSESDRVELAMMALGVERMRPTLREIGDALAAGSYRAVLFNNFIPTVSLAAPELCRQHGLRVFHWAHNSRLSCANGVSFDGNEACAACFEHGSRSVLARSCFPSKAQATLYASVYRGRRVPRTLLRVVDEWLVSAEYSARQIQHAASTLGIPTRTRTIRMTPGAAVVEGEVSPEIRSYVSAHADAYYLYVGRLSFEKGADRFVDLARAHPEAAFAIAGKGPMDAEVRASAPPNLAVLGFVSAAERQHLIASARALVVPSRAPENSPVVLFESHFAKTPVFYAPGGGAEEVSHWLERDARPLSEFSTALQFERRGRSFRGDEFRNDLAAWARTFAR
jgi:glycosyltransferase involved in cell wall biosynthesis